MITKKKAVVPPLFGVLLLCSFGSLSPKSHQSLKGYLPTTSDFSSSSSYQFSSSTTNAGGGAGHHGANYHLSEQRKTLVVTDDSLISSALPETTTTTTSTWSNPIIPHHHHDDDQLNQEIIISQEEEEQQVGVYPEEEEEGEQERGTSTTLTPPATTTTTTSCAILFVGLPRSFKTLVLPSIKKNVIPNNPNCDYFVHAYNKTKEAQSRSGIGGKIDPNEIFLLRNAVKKYGRSSGGGGGSSKVTFLIETEEEFEESRKSIINKIMTERDEIDGSLVYFPKMGGFQNSTVLNVIKQWHSIESAWHFMERFEQTHRGGQLYDRVAILRSDVMFVTPINVQQGEETSNAGSEVIVPGFALYPVNDRLIYGPRAGVEIWANQRFSRIEQHVHTTIHQKRIPGAGIHPERFLKYTIFPAIREAAAHHDGGSSYTIREHPSICVLRARPHDLVWANDCYNPYWKVGEKITHEMANLYQNKNMRVVVEETLGRNCLTVGGKKWTSKMQEIYCPPKSTLIASFHHQQQSINNNNANNNNQEEEGEQ